MRTLKYLLICVSLSAPAFAQPLTAIGNNGTAKWNNNYLDVRNGELVVGDSIVYLKGVNFEPTTGWNKGWDWWVDPADTVNKYLDQQFAFLSDTLLGDVNIVRTMLNDSAFIFTSINTRIDSFLTKAARKGIKVVFNVLADSGLAVSPLTPPYNLVYSKRGNRPWNTTKNVINAFKNDKRIAWWEFKNEFSNILYPTFPVAAQDTIYQCVKRWVDSVKANDTNHLVAGFNESLYHTSHYLKANGHDISLTNDLLPFHDYEEFSDTQRRPTNPAQTSIFYTFGGLWQAHDWLQKERIFGIPIVIGEHGAHSGYNPPIKRNLEWQRRFIDEHLKTYDKNTVKGVIFWSIRDGIGSVSDTHIGSKSGLIMKDSTHTKVRGRKPAFYTVRSWTLQDGEKRQTITTSREEDLTFRLPPKPPNDVVQVRNQIGQYNFFLNGDFRHWTAGTTFIPSGFDWSYGTNGELNCRATREDTLSAVGAHSLRIATTSANGGVRQAIHEHLSEYGTTSGGGRDGAHQGWRETLKGKWVTLSGWFMAAPTNRGYSVITLSDGIQTTKDSLKFKGKWEYVVMRRLIDSRDLAADASTTPNQLYVNFNLTVANDSMYVSGVVLNEGRDPIPFVNNPRDFLVYHVVSPVIDLGGPDVTYRLYVNPGDLQYGADGQNVFSTSTSERRKYKGVKKVVVQYTEATSADAGVAIRLGHAGHGGIGSGTAFLNSTSATSKAAGDLVDLTSSISSPGQLGSLAGNLNLTCGTAGGKIGTGAFQLHIYLLDYN